MKIDEAIKTLREHGYLSILTHSDTIQEIAVSEIKRKLDPKELEQVINYLETVSDPSLGLNVITIGYAIRHIAVKHQGVPAVRAFFKQLREYGITEVFESEHGLNGFLIQYFKLIRTSGDRLDIITITKEPDVFYVYHSGNAQSMEKQVEEILNAKWYTTE